MTALELIRQKRDGQALSAQAIQFLVAGATDGSIPDYQLAAWLMAVRLRGMTEAETTALTLAMAASGRQLDLSSIPGRKVDKHSTGGVGDKTTLVVAPLVAAGGVPVAKLSGRGLGVSGGALDQLQSVRGFGGGLSDAGFLAQPGRLGGVGTGPAARLPPAGRKARDTKSALARIDRALADGSGFAKFRELVAAQGGDVAQVDDPSKLPRAPKVETLRAPHPAYVSAIAADEVGIASVRLGAGRGKEGEAIDHRTGIVLHAKVGDRGERGEPYAEVHVAGKPTDVDAIAMIRGAFRWSVRRVPRRRLLLGRIASR